ncbi:MAG: hypothetical protein GKR89_01580 [Candidatus Latescibacteria bacterium]|nr:hypothetical protein [Candidatus Latescibacterota bacterium]
MTSLFIATATPELQKIAWGELVAVDADLRRRGLFKDGVFMVESGLEGQAFAQAVVAADPIFVKHIMPVQRQVELGGAMEADLAALEGAVLELEPLPTGAPFSVQCRRVGPAADYRAKDVEVRLGMRLEELGGVPRFSDMDAQVDPKQQVVSIFLFGSRGYVGRSAAGENLNDHCDEYRIFSRHARAVSRAEFKLLEALRKFGLQVNGGRAIDLGAAPGGWTKVLADRGMEVVAIDPGQLLPVVTALPGVTYVQGKAEDYEGDGEFDLLVNDMNMDPEDSAKLMVDMAPWLKQGSQAVLTVKLVIRNPDRLLENTRQVLEPAYAIERIKHLFHNRLEVTVLLRRR